MSDYFWFTDAQWARIEPLLPQDIRGKKRVDDRRVLSGIVQRLIDEVEQTIVTHAVKMILLSRKGEKSFGN